MHNLSLKSMPNAALDFESGNGDIKQRKLAIIQAKKRSLYLKKILIGFFETIHIKVKSIKVNGSLCQYTFVIPHLGGLIDFKKLNIVISDNFPKSTVRIWMKNGKLIIELSNMINIPVLFKDLVLMNEEYDVVNTVIGQDAVGNPIYMNFGKSNYNLLITGENRKERRDAIFTLIYTAIDKDLPENLRFVFTSPDNENPFRFLDKYYLNEHQEKIQNKFTNPYMYMPVVTNGEQVSQVLAHFAELIRTKKRLTKIVLVLEDLSSFKLSEEDTLNLKLILQLGHTINLYTILSENSEEKVPFKQCFRENLCFKNTLSENPELPLDKIETYGEFFVIVSTGKGKKKYIHGNLPYFDETQKYIQNSVLALKFGELKYIHRLESQQREAVYA